MDYASLYSWARDDLLEETFIYTTRLKLKELRESQALSKTCKNWVKVKMCNKGEPMCLNESANKDGPFYFMYDTLFIKSGLCFPLEMFEKEIIAIMNVSLAQLHLNGWAFIRAFKILCNNFGVSPLSNVFFNFF